MLTRDQFSALFPHADADVWLVPLNQAMEAWGVDTLPRQAAFLAQIGHESGGLKHVRELASGAAYEGRADLGNVEPGDGRRFKGRGLIQITGRSNYNACAAALGIDCIGTPELLELPAWAAQSAGWYWSSRGLNALADVGNFKLITKRINGGYNGLADREYRWKRATEILTGVEAEQLPAPVEDRAMPLPIVAAIAEASIPILISKLPELAAILTDKDKKVSERNVEGAVKVLEAIQEVTGASTHQEAVQKLDDPEVVTVVREKVKDMWYELREVGGGQQAARVADLERAKAKYPIWMSGAFWVTVMLMPILYGITWALLFEDSGLPNDTRAAIISLMAGTAIGAIAGYWFGSSFGSQRKDEVKGSMAD